ncbi:hypothetical protein GCM10027294_21860 [Marinactinospora endophytica]
MGAQLRAVPGLQDHFPPSGLRDAASGKPPTRGLLPPPSLPLPWHLPRITGRRHNGKANGARLAPTR